MRPAFFRESQSGSWAAVDLDSESRAKPPVLWPGGSAATTEPVWRQPAARNVATIKRLLTCLDILPLNSPYEARITGASAWPLAQSRHFGPESLLCPVVYARIHEVRLQKGACLAGRCAGGRAVINRCRAAG